jgi:hypothetical protein
MQPCPRLVITSLKDSAGQEAESHVTVRSAKATSSDVPSFDRPPRNRCSGISAGR